MFKKFLATLTLLAFIFTSACGLPGTLPNRPLPPSSLFIASEVLQNMFEIQREYEQETVRCLTGFVDAGIVHVMSSEPTWINASDNMHANFRSCEQENVVGWYHNHPGWLGPDNEQIHSCDFSDQDLITHAGLDLPIAVISCAPNTVIWRFRRNPRTFTWTGEVPPP